jgi:hypothetical protein
MCSMVIFSYRGCTELSLLRQMGDAGALEKLQSINCSLVGLSCCILHYAMVLQR